MKEVFYSKNFLMYIEQLQYEPRSLFLKHDIQQYSFLQTIDDNPHFNKHLHVGVHHAQETLPN